MPPSCRPRGRASGGPGRSPLEAVTAWGPRPKAAQDAVGGGREKGQRSCTGKEGGGEVGRQMYGEKTFFSVWPTSGSLFMLSALKPPALPNLSACCSCARLAGACAVSREIYKLSKVNVVNKC